MRSQFSTSGTALAQRPSRDALSPPEDGPSASGVSLPPPAAVDSTLTPTTDERGRIDAKAFQKIFQDLHVAAEYEGGKLKLIFELPQGDKFRINFTNKDGAYSEDPRSYQVDAVSELRMKEYQAIFHREKGNPKVKCSVSIDSDQVSELRINFGTSGQHCMTISKQLLEELHKIGTQPATSSPRVISSPPPMAPVVTSPAPQVPLVPQSPAAPNRAVPNQEELNTVPAPAASSPPAVNSSVPPISPVVPSPNPPVPSVPQSHSAPNPAAPDQAVTPLPPSPVISATIPSPAPDRLREICAANIPGLEAAVEQVMRKSQPFGTNGDPRRVQLKIETVQEDNDKTDYD